MPPRSGDKPLEPIGGWDRINKSRPLPLSKFQPLKFISKEERPFQYRIQVQTQNRRTKEMINRTITVSDDARNPIGDVLADGADVIMESPIASREDLVTVFLISAHRWSG